MKKLLILLLLTSSVFASNNQDKLNNIETLNNFVFASCNKRTNTQELWTDINRDTPELFIWGGDIIYGDKKPYQHDLVKKYSLLNQVEGYKQLKTQTPIIGVWDDHDYGVNNGDHTNPKKYFAKKALLDFLEEPLLSPRWEHSGVYTSYTFGTGEKKVKFILLDNRFNLSKKGGILGGKQRAWFEQELSNSDAKIHFIVTGMPFLPSSMVWTEEWSDYPSSKAYMLETLNKYKPSGVIFLTGDKHFGAISQKENLIEIMSSGMTHGPSKIFYPLLRKRFHNPYFQLNYAFINIDWDATPLQVTAQIKGRENKVAIERVLKLNGIYFQ